MHMRFSSLGPAEILGAAAPVRQGGVACGFRITARGTSAAFAAALLTGGSPGVSRGAPPLCADVLKSIEKRLAHAGVHHPPLKIVPKSLSAGYRVVGTCEGGTQRIVHDVEPAPSPKDAGKEPGKPRSPSKKS
jgi:hypothetical protein